MSETLHHALDVRVASSDCFIPRFVISLTLRTNVRVTSCSNCLRQTATHAYATHLTCELLPCTSTSERLAITYATHLTCELLQQRGTQKMNDITYATHLTCELLQQKCTIVRDACTGFMYRVCTLPRVKPLPESRITPTCSV